jgi:L-fucose isomerase-like protein
MKLGILPLGRPTFDVEYAGEKLAAMLAALDATGHEIRGPRELLFDADSTKAGIAELQSAGVDQVLLLQVTFTDASMTVAAANAFDAPLSIWAVPEPRSGGRLRLNAFCGLNLASHALRRNGRGFGWLYADPATDVSADLTALLSGSRMVGTASPGAAPAPTEEGRRIAEAVRGRRIARIGDHPEGFDTCAYDADAVDALAGVKVDALELDDLFDAARKVPETEAAALRAEADSALAGLDEVDQPQLDRSLRLKAGLDDLRGAGGYDAFAIRCWPETFTEYGGAVCGPAGMLGEAKVPCACEADVYGALTQLVLMEAARAPVFLTDLVDMDAGDNSGVVWHCGQAPLSMRDPKVEAEATVHTNRKQPLLFQFPLKPGPVTLMRISQANGRPHMVLAKADMLERPMAFTGTSGVLRFGRGAGQVLDDIIACGLEHHMALAYGDHRAALRGTAGAMGLPLLEL